MSKVCAHLFDPPVGDDELEAAPGERSDIERPGQRVLHDVRAGHLAGGPSTSRCTAVAITAIRNPLEVGVDQVVVGGGHLESPSITASSATANAPFAVPASHEPRRT